MSTGLPVSDVSNVQVIMSPLAAAVRNFGAVLLLGYSDVVDTAERMRLYNGTTDIARDFGTEAEEYKAALRFFGQEPKPAFCYIGRWAKTATHGLLKGGVLSASQQLLDNFTDITNGGMTISIDGTEINLSEMNFSDATNLNGVASALTDFIESFAGDPVATVVWNAGYGRFEVISTTTGVDSTVSYASEPGSGDDVSGLFGFQDGQASPPVDGIAAETIADCVANFADLSNDWYGLYITDPALVKADVLSVCDFIDADSITRVFGYTVTTSLAMDSSDTTNIGAAIYSAAYKRTFTQYSSSENHAAASIFGRMSTVDFTAQNSTLTIKFKTEPGITAESLRSSQAAMLKARKINVFVKYQNNTAIIQEGVMADGSFIDERHGLDWLQNNMQNEEYNLLYASGQPKIPQTDAGFTQFVAVDEKSLDRAVNNGLAAPGVWNGPSFGALKTGDYLTKGYYVYCPPAADQDQSEREQRTAPTRQIALKLAGAVHKSNVIINVNR